MAACLDKLAASLTVADHVSDGAEAQILSNGFSIDSEWIYAPLNRSSGGGSLEICLVGLNPGGDKELELLTIDLIAPVIAGALSNAQEYEHLLEVNSDLQDEHRCNDMILRSISSIMITVDESGRITNWNEAAARAFGVPIALALGEPLEVVGIKWDWDAVQNSIGECLVSGDGSRLTELVFTSSTGSKGVLTLNFNSMFNADGELLGVLILADDHTEKERLGRELASARRLESIGQLAAGIAHEINTPTQYVGDNTRFLDEAFSAITPLLEQANQLASAVKQGEASSELAEKMIRSLDEADLEFMQEEIPRAIKQSLDGVGRVSRIVHAMKEFSHPGAEGKSEVHLLHAVESTVTVAGAEWRYVANVEIDVDSNLPFVSCYAGELNQVLLNMIVNASHAIGDVVADRAGEKGLIKVSAELDGKWVEIRISDSGGGISEEVRDRMFDPFFTTKGVGKGTGQGLAIAHDVIVNKHNGTIGVESVVGEGTTFVIRIPLRDE
ncbi:MAG: PAS domain S-box-containing protein [Planctomycetota bacterium]|jgi:PAS domain S-box-containing protein